MRKNLLFSLVFIACLSSLRAQVRLGIEGGIHSANVLETNNIPGWDSSYKPFYSSYSGFHVGIVADIPLGKKGFYFQPGLRYTTKGRQFSKYNDSNNSILTDTIYSQSTLKLAYIEAPVYITYKIPLSANHNNSFFIGAGPYFSFFYSGTLSSQNRILSTNKYNTGDEDLLVGNAPDKYKTFDFGVNAKAGFELGSITLYGFYSRGLSNFYTAPYDATFHHELMGATLGIWIAKTTPPVPIMKPDADHDGLPDDEDLCPNLPGSLKYHGCPIPDTDGDGVDDEYDSCKTFAGSIKYHGCPVPDTDGDGVDDEHDSCKTVAGSPKYHGCPIPDRDHDGVNDEEDKCPDIAGPVENHGCPPIKLEIRNRVKFVSKNILFATASDKLTTSSFSALDELSDVLKAHPEFYLSIAGHTDNVGKPENNLVLSQKRADAVKNYLVMKGVRESHVSTVGKGESDPITDNQTAEGRASNRRVELKLDTKKIN